MHPCVVLIPVLLQLPALHVLLVFPFDMSPARTFGTLNSLSQYRYKCKDVLEACRLTDGITNIRNLVVVCRRALQNQ